MTNAIHRVVRDTHLVPGLETCNNCCYYDVSCKGLVKKVGTLRFKLLEEASKYNPMHVPSQELERKLEEALSCPCVADLRDGPCGPSFVGAFSCFIRSQTPEKVCCFRLSSRVALCL
jgi:hypothetical protein